MADYYAHQLISAVGYEKDSNGASLKVTAAQTSDQMIHGHEQ